MTELTDMAPIDPVVTSGTDPASSSPLQPSSSAIESEPGLDGAAPPAPEIDWRQRIAGSDAALAKQLERFADETALAQSWLHAQKTISSGKKIEAPQADWTEEQWDTLYDKLGRPKDPNGYKVELKLPEGIELPDETRSVLGNVTQAGHKLGLTTRQMQGVHEFVANLAVEQLQQSEQAVVENRARSERALKELWGPEYSQNLRYAEAAVNQLHRETGVDWRGLANLVTQDGAKLGDRVEFVRLMAAAGRALGSDPLLDVRSEGVATSLESKKAALLNLRLSEPKRYASSEVQQELQEIYRALERK